MEHCKLYYEDHLSTLCLSTLENMQEVVLHVFSGGSSSGGRGGGFLAMLF